MSRRRGARYLDGASDTFCVLGGDASFGAALVFCVVVVGSGFGVVENVRSKQSRMAWSDVMSMQFGPACAEFDEMAMHAAAEINKIRMAEILVRYKGMHCNICGRLSSNRPKSGR
ncbi:hypothetical protein [Bradyrhizobium sp. CB2312]|uniref:hypothetical protein n=1 Tax=Bradyrhizobium sp. CB2312 TaxID=3039155 RepID=UPI0024B0F54B|nr:hypothetical protein [Bradyrhizobium sp. CB2312]WFU70943.1 hypothetical protein QA642_37655 [Bradyrhizobium sp. CB2312]